MEFINNHQQLIRALTMYVFGGVDESNLSMEQRAKFLEHATLGMPGDIIANSAEYMYAHYDLLDEEGKTLALQLFSFCTRSGWAESLGDQRYQKIVSFLLEEKGMEHIEYEDDAPPKPKVKMRDEEIDWRVEEGLVVEETPLVGPPTLQGPVLELEDEVIPPQGEPTS